MPQTRPHHQTAGKRDRAHAAALDLDARAHDHAADRLSSHQDDNGERLTLRNLLLFLRSWLRGISGGALSGLIKDRIQRLHRLGRLFALLLGLLTGALHVAPERSENMDNVPCMAVQ